MNPRARFGLMVVVFFYIAVVAIVVYLFICGYQNQNAFQNQFDDEMILCFEDECAWLTFYPESEGGVVGNAMNWLVLIDPDGHAILRHGEPHWHGIIRIRNNVVYFSKLVYT